MEYLFFLAAIVFAYLYWDLKKKQQVQHTQQAAQQRIVTEQRIWDDYIRQFDPERNKLPLPPEYTKVAGVTYQNTDTGEDRQKIIGKLKNGERLLLIPDELNQFDREAVKVVRLNGEQIGFLNADLAIEIKSRLKAGSRVDARVVSITGEIPKGVNIELVKYSRKAPKF
jgi:hypothetical protein